MYGLNETIEYGNGQQGLVVYVSDTLFIMRCFEGQGFVACEYADDDFIFVNEGPDEWRKTQAEALNDLVAYVRAL